MVQGDLSPSSEQMSSVRVRALRIAWVDQLVSQIGVAQSRCCPETGNVPKQNLVTLPSNASHAC
jgi:hypothetical protein